VEGLEYEADLLPAQLERSASLIEAMSVPSRCRVPLVGVEQTQDVEEGGFADPEGPTTAR